QPGRLAPEALRRLDEARGALGAAHGAPRATLEGRARGPRRGAHLLDRALRRVAGGLLGRRVDHRVRPPRGAHPLATDKDLVDDGDAHAACALSAASRWRVVRCIGSVSNFGSTCLPKVSIDSRTYFWSRVRVKGAQMSWSTPSASNIWITRTISSGEPIWRPPTARPAFSCSGVLGGTLIGPVGGKPFGRGMESSQPKKNSVKASTRALE